MAETEHVKNAPSAALWNPNAAANWSVIFTPMFGAYLQTLNWRALGESEQASASMKWFYVGLGLLAAYVVLAAFVHDFKAGEIIAQLVGFIFLLSWYFGSGRVQAKYVRMKHGNDFPRRPWAKPLLIALGGLIGYVAVAVAVWVAVAVARGD